MNLHSPQTGFSFLFIQAWNRLSRLQKSILYMVGAVVLLTTLYYGLAANEPANSAHRFSPLEGKGRDSAALVSYGFFARLSVPRICLTFVNAKLCH